MSAAHAAAPAPNPLDYALAYAALGWRVIPIQPGAKYPAGIDEWQKHATTNVDTLRRWWGAGGRFHGWGVGLATGPESGVFALDVDPDHGGDDSLADLERRHGRLPDTVESITGGGGRHLLFRFPAGLTEGQRLGNSAGKLAVGLDIRSDRGQIVVAPTVHPETKRRYEWEASSLPGATPVADAPAWLLELIVEDEATALVYDDAGPMSGDAAYAVERMNMQGNEGAIALLERHGWTLLRTDRQGVAYMKRPGQTDERRHGACVGKVAPGVTVVFTGSCTPLEAERGYRIFDLYALLEHGGDRVAAEVELVRQGRGAPTSPGAINAVDPGWLERYVSAATPTVAASTGESIERGSSWEPTDVAAAVDIVTADGYEREMPSIGTFIDDPAVGIWYVGRVNALYGEPTLGKTWISLFVVAQILKGGQTVAWIDLEEPVEGLVQRLIDLDVHPDVLRSNLIHFAPEEKLQPDSPILAHLQERQPALIVIDSTGEALALEGAKPNDDDEVARWFQSWCRRFARVSGAAVVAIDHVVKDRESRGSWASGSQRKKSALTGSGFMVDVVEHLGKGHIGRLKLTCVKDRLGNYRPGEHVATFILDESELGRLLPALQRPSKEEIERANRPPVEDAKERVLNRLDEDGPMFMTALIKSIGGDDHVARDAVRQLEKVKSVRVESIGSGKRVSLVEGSEST